MKDIERHRLSNNWEYAKKVWLNERKKHNLLGWSLVLSSTMSEVGLCNYSEKTIYISSIYMRGCHCNYKKVKKVLMHEIAHALTPGHSHNDVWKNKCRRIGGDTRLAASMDLPGLDWAMYCRKCRWRQEYKSKPNVQNKICSVCRETVFVKYIK